MKLRSVLSLAALAFSSAASAESFNARKQAEVEALVVCYARGTDLLGSAVTAVHTAGDLDSRVNTAHPAFADALELYRRCFSENFSFTLQVDGVHALTVPDPVKRTPATDAALQWANYVNNAFREAGYRNTQHHMGSISSRVQGQQADVVSYLIATHVFGPDAAEPAGSVAVIGGTYTDRVVRNRGVWLIEQRTLNVTSNVITRSE